MNTNFGIVSEQQIGVDHKELCLGQVWANRKFTDFYVVPSPDTFNEANLYVVREFTGRQVIIENIVTGTTFGMMTLTLRQQFTFVY